MAMRRSLILAGVVVLPGAAAQAAVWYSDSFDIGSNPARTYNAATDVNGNVGLTAAGASALQTNNTDTANLVWTGYRADTDLRFTRNAGTFATGTNSVSGGAAAGVLNNRNGLIDHSALLPIPLVGGIQQKAFRMSVDLWKRSPANSKDATSVGIPATTTDERFAGLYLGTSATSNWYDSRTNVQIGIAPNPAGTEYNFVIKQRVAGGNGWVSVQSLSNGTHAAYFRENAWNNISADINLTTGLVTAYLTGHQMASVTLGATAIVGTYPAADGTTNLSTANRSTGPLRGATGFIDRQSGADVGDYPTITHIGLYDNADNSMQTAFDNFLVTSFPAPATRPSVERQAGTP
jgi:hypothetical protein